MGGGEGDTSGRSGWMENVMGGGGGGVTGGRKGTSRRGVSIRL